MKLLTIDTPEDYSVLKTVSAPVADITPDLAELTDRMILFMKETNGIGLAAPQIGINQRFFVIQIEEQQPLVFFNPEILETAIELSTYEEGCLSIPGTWAKVARPARVQVQAWNAKGRPFRLEASGLLATCIQHENDHLNGKLFIEHLPQRRLEKILRGYQGDTFRKRL